VRACVGAGQFSRTSERTSVIATRLWTRHTSARAVRGRWIAGRPRSSSSQKG